MNDNITLAMLLYLVSAGLYAFIGFSLGRKTFDDKTSAQAWNAFRIWWFAMAINNVLNLLSVGLFSQGITDLNVHLAIKVANIVAPSVALWGLLSYLVYVFTGNRRANMVLTIFYVLFAIALIYGTLALQPTGVRMDEWNTALDNRITGEQLGEAASWAIALSFLLAIALPPFLAAIGFFMLYFRVKERSQKYRSIMVPAGIIIIFGFSVILPLLLYPFGVRVSEVSWWPVTIRALGVLALIMIYWAYYPPRFIQKTLQVTPIV